VYLMPLERFELVSELVPYIRASKKPKELQC
jgi:hypothetical protein